MSITEPGVYDMSPEEYHADPVAERSLSSTVGRWLLQHTPMHARHWIDNPVEKSTFDVGRAAHRVVLGKGQPFAVYPPDVLSSNGAVSTKAAKAWEAEQRAAGVTPIKAETEEAIYNMAAAVEAHLEACGLALEPQHSERVAIGQCDGVWIRAMIDNAPADAPVIYDLKTTTDASPEACVRAVANYGYDVQAAHYLDAWEAATGERRAFRFVCVEKEPPHGCSVVELYDDPDDPADWMLDARSKAAEARRIWKRCLATGEWPGYPAGVAVIGAPTWHRAKWEARELTPDTDDKPSAAALRAAYEAQAPMEDV